MTEEDVVSHKPEENDFKIIPVDFETEMKSSYLDYSMSVIVGRALPDVRDGLKPVHRRVLYGMYAGHYYSDRQGSRRQFYKCARVVGDVMGNYHPHGDVAIYDTLVRMAQDWNLRYPLIDGQGNFGGRGDSKQAAMRYTECLMGRLAMEVVRDIDKETVEFMETYDGRSTEPVVLPSRFPNLLVNGSSGIAVGMATNIPTHNLREIALAVHYYLEHFDMPRRELLDELLKIVPGPDFPTGGYIIGRGGIISAYTTGRGCVTMRGVVDVIETGSKIQLVIKELPYQVNPDRLLERIEDLVKNDVIPGISAIDDYSSGREGLNIVITLKRDAVAKVVLNNLYKHTSLQDTFGCNMLALVDGVPKTLALDMFIKYWVKHQIEVIQRRSIFIQRKAQERAHILEGYLKALSRIDEVVKLIRASKDVETARVGLIDLLAIDDTQAKAILAMQLSRLAALEQEKITKENNELQVLISEMQNILDTPERQRSIVGQELDQIVEEFGDERRTQILPEEGVLSDEAFIKEEEIVITVSRGGMIKRTNLDLYRTQHRGGKGIQGVKIRDDDLIQNFFSTTTHHHLLFFTNLGRMYRAKGYEVPAAGRDTKGQHVANLLELQPEEKVVQILDIPNFEAAQYLFIATKSGKVKKTPLVQYSKVHSHGIIAVNLNIDHDHQLDEVVSAKLINDDDTIILVSRKAQAVKFEANNQNIRPTARASVGVRGMRLRPGDQMLAADVLPKDAGPDWDLLVVTTGGYAKRTPVEAFRKTNRGGLGVKLAKFQDYQGELVGALVVDKHDEVLGIMESGKVVRSLAQEVSQQGRYARGVVFAKMNEGDRIMDIAKNFERVGIQHENELAGDDKEFNLTGSQIVESEVDG